VNGRTRGDDVVDEGDALAGEAGACIDKGARDVGAAFGQVLPDLAVGAADTRQAGRSLGKREILKQEFGLVKPALTQARPVEGYHKAGIEDEVGQCLSQQAPHNGRDGPVVAVLQVVDELAGGAGHLEGAADARQMLEVEAARTEVGAIPAGRTVAATSRARSGLEGCLAGPAEGRVECAAAGTAERKEQVGGGLQEMRRHGRQCT